MNVLNRLLMLIGCLALVVCGIAVIALTWTIPGETIDWLRGATDWMERHNQETEKALLTAIAAVVAFLGLVLLLLELLPDNSDVKVTDLNAGGAVLSTADVQQRVEAAVRTVDHVINVKASVKGKRKGVAVLLNLDVDPDANLAHVTDEACEAAREVLANKVHVALAEPPQARLHYRELRFKTRTVKDTGASAAASPAAEEAPDAITPATERVPADSRTAIAPDEPAGASSRDSIPEPVAATASAPAEEPNETTTRA